MRRDAFLAEDYARRHNVPKFYSRASDLINDKEIDAVYIATPPSSHAEYAIEVIKAGKPVYIEKPMAASYSECLKINKAAEKYGVPVFVAYYRRTLPGFLMVKDLIEKGSIGNVRFVSLQLFKAPSQMKKKESFHGGLILKLQVQVISMILLRISSTISIFSSVLFRK